jgi:predicted DNA-binding protein
MKASTKKAIPKKRGRPATGKDPSRTFRLSDEFMTNLEAWATANGVTRSEAIRRLVEIGLKAKGG